MGNGAVIFVPASRDIPSNLKSGRKLTRQVQCGADALRHIAIKFEHHAMLSRYQH